MQMIKNMFDVYLGGCFLLHAASGGFNNKILGMLFR